MIPNGRYTIVYSNNQYRTIQLSTPKRGGLAGKQIFSIPAGDHTFRGIAFVTEQGLKFWYKFSSTQEPERLARIRRAYEIVSGDPEKAGKAYGVTSGRCCICNRELTTPASLNAGIGPECAGKVSWSQADQVAAAIAMRPTVTPKATAKPEPKTVEELWEAMGVN